MFRGVIVVSVIMLFVAGPWMSAHAAPVTVRAVSAWSKSAQFETQQFLAILDTIQKEANQKYPGQLVIDYKGAGEVIPTQQQVEALRSGLVDMILTAASYYTSIMPEMDVMSLTTMKPWEERKAGVNDYLEKLHNAKANAHYLARLGSGDLFHVFLAKPVQKIADFKGMKIRRRCARGAAPSRRRTGSACPRSARRTGLPWIENTDRLRQQTAALHER